MLKQHFQPLTLWHCFTADLAYRAPDEKHTIRKLGRMFVFSPGYRAVVFIRLANFLKDVTFANYITNIMSQLLLARLCSVPGVEIHTSRIGLGLLMSHPHDIVIGNGCTIASKVTIFNGVTLGAKTLLKYDATPERYPTIEDNVTLFTGAKILGPITIGAGSIVGANSVVLDSFPPRSIIAGIPAIKIGEIPK